MEINVKKLIDNGLNPNEYVYLYYMYLHSRKTIRELFLSDFTYIIAMEQSLMDRGFIKRGRNEREIILLQKTVDLFELKKLDFDAFIAEYRAVWDKENINGVIGKKGSKSGCEAKMKLFMAANPEYSMDTIIQAARLYVESQRYESNFKYLQQADYVISKQQSDKTKGSRLEAYCEEIVDGATVEGKDEDLFTTKV